MLSSLVLSALIVLGLGGGVFGALALQRRTKLLRSELGATILIGASMLVVVTSVVQLIELRRSALVAELSFRQTLRGEILSAVQGVTDLLAEQHVKLAEARRVLRTDESPMRQRLSNMQRFRDLVRDPKSAQWYYAYSMGDYMKFEEKLYDEHPEYQWLDRKAELALLEQEVLSSRSTLTAAWYRLAQTLQRNRAYYPETSLELLDLQNEFLHDLERTDELLKLFDVSMLDGEKKSLDQAEWLIRNVQGELEQSALMLASLEAQIQQELLGGFFAGSAERLQFIPNPLPLEDRAMTPISAEEPNASYAPSFSSEDESGLGGR